MDSLKTHPLRMIAGTSFPAISLLLALLASAFAAGTAAEPSLLVTSQLDHTVKQYDGTTGAFIRNCATDVGDPLDAIIGADGNLLVTDGQQDAIKRFDWATGAYLGVFASAVSPGGMTLADGKVYVCHGNPPQIIRSFDAETGTDAGSFFPTIGDGNPGPRDVKVAHGRLYVLYYNLGAVETFDLATRQSMGPLFTPGAGELFTPFSMAFGPDGDLYIAHGFFVNRYDALTGEFLGRFVDTGDRFGQRYAVGIAWGPDGNLYVATQNTPGVQRYHGTTGAFIDDFVPAGTGELTAPFHISFTPFQACQAEMAFDFTPSTLDLTSQGLWVTGFFEPVAPHAAGDIDISSIRLNGTVAVDPSAPSAIGDHDDDGIADLMVKFDRVEVELTLPEGENVPVTATGKVDDCSFSAVDYVTVRRAVVTGPPADTLLIAGGVAEVRWQVLEGVPIRDVALLETVDGGATWSLVEKELPNTGSYAWTVPVAQSSQARVAVVLVQSSDETGNIVEGVLGISGTFSIETTLGVDGAPARLALGGVTPNPARREMRVRIGLADSQPATLALFDVGGRQIETRRVESLGPGWHTVTLGEGVRLPAGFYVVRLVQNGRSLARRVAVIR